MGWKLYGEEYWQRDDGNAEVFKDRTCPGYRVKIWRRYKRGSAGTRQISLLEADLASPEVAMELADRELPEAQQS